MNALFGSGLTESSIRSRPCSISGTTHKASSTRFEPTTGISILFGNKRRRPTERGIWFHFAERIRSVDQICRAYNARFKGIRIHLLPSERLERYRDRQAGQDSAAEIRPGMARRPPWLQASSLTGSKGHGHGSSSVRIPQTREAICNQRRIGRERTRRAPKITHKMNSPCRKRTAVASAE